MSPLHILWSPPRNLWEAVSPPQAEPDTFLTTLRRGPVLTIPNLPQGRAFFLPPLGGPGTPVLRLTHSASRCIIAPVVCNELLLHLSSALNMRPGGDHRTPGLEGGGRAPRLLLAPCLDCTSLHTPPTPRNTAGCFELKENTAMSASTPTSGRCGQDICPGTWVTEHTWLHLRELSSALGRGPTLSSLTASEIEARRGLRRISGSRSRAASQSSAEAHTREGKGKVPDHEGAL
jgi:hypothetical protein